MLTSRGSRPVGDARWCRLRATRAEPPHSIRSRAGQSDRRTHRLQRRPGAPVRDRPRGDGRGASHRLTPDRGPCDRPRRARQLRTSRPRARAGMAGFRTGGGGRARALRRVLARSAAPDQRGRSARCRSVVLGRSRGGAGAGTAGSGRAARARPRGAGQNLLGGRERVGRRAHGPARPARLAVR